MLEQHITYFENGEVHVCHDALRRTDIATKIQRFLPVLPGIKSVNVDTENATLVLLYDVKKVSKERLLQMLQQGEVLLRSQK